MPFDVEKMKVDLASLSGHKIYGPKGVGALYVRRKPRVRLAPIIDGGGHERGMRSGTLNVPGIVGLGKAAELCRPADARGVEAHLGPAHAAAETSSSTSTTRAQRPPDQRLPGNLNISFAYVEGEALMMAIKDVAVSSRLGLHRAPLEPSYVLRAWASSEDLAHSSIRFGIGRFNTEDEVDYVIEDVVDQVKKLREMSPLYEMAKEGIDSRRSSGRPINKGVSSIMDPWHPI